jgi:hypothetical protein
VTASGPMEATTVTVTIDRPPEEVCSFVTDLQNLPRWSFFESAAEDGPDWMVTTSGGESRLRLASPNQFGVLDHHVTTPNGSEIYIPMRVVANAGGSEVMFTAYRMPGMTDDAYAADVAQVRADLESLKRILEDRHG